MTNREAYIVKIRAKVDEWDQEISRIEAKARRASEPSGAALEAALAEMKARRDEAEARLRAARATSEAGWGVLSSEFETAWSAVSDAFGAASARAR